LVVAASALLDRYGNAIQAIEHDGFPIAARVYMVVEGENLVTSAKSTGLGLVELATVFDNLKPDAVVTIADRYETLANAVAASYMNIPVVHVQGGEVTGSIDEKVCHAVTKLSNLHLVSTKGAAERVKKLGEVPESVVITGCPSIDIAAEVAAKPALDFDPLVKYGGVGPNKFDLSKGYLVVMQHPVTTEYEEARRQVEETLYAVKSVDLPVLWFWPNVDAGSDGTSKGIRVFREREKQTTCTCSATCFRRTSCGCWCTRPPSSAIPASRFASARSSASPPSMSGRVSRDASAARTCSTSGTIARPLPARFVSMPGADGRRPITSTATATPAAVSPTAWPLRHSPLKSG